MITDALKKIFSPKEIKQNFTDLLNGENVSGNSLRLATSAAAYAAMPLGILSIISSHISLPFSVSAVEVAAASASLAVFVSTAAQLAFGRNERENQIHPANENERENTEIEIGLERSVDGRSTSATSATRNENERENTEIEIGLERSVDGRSTSATSATREGNIDLRPAGNIVNGTASRLSGPTSNQITP